MRNMNEQQVLCVVHRWVRASLSMLVCLFCGSRESIYLRKPAKVPQSPNVINQNEIGMVESSIVERLINSIRSICSDSEFTAFFSLHLRLQLKRTHFNRISFSYTVNICLKYIGKFNLYSDLFYPKIYRIDRQSGAARFQADAARLGVGRSAIRAIFPTTLAIPFCINFALGCVRASKRFVIIFGSQTTLRLKMN